MLPDELFRLTIARDMTISVDANIVLIIAVVLGVGAVITITKVVLSKLNIGWGAPFQIDEAQIGIGSHSITMRPNVVDRQIAYKIWVELSTRKIGLEIDLEHDVVSEVYDSWHTFFSVTRELIKDVPVNKFRRKDTERIIRLSIDVLNDGLRPHLTKWQARFRRWYESELGQNTNIALAPQEIQKQFPKFLELQTDLLMVNKRLIEYRKKMYELVTR